MATSSMLAFGRPALDILRRVFGWLLFAMTIVLRLVSYLFPRQMNPTTGKGKLHPTSYLDSLRGYAAWIVVNGHILSYKQPASPWFRIFFHGAFQVATFYVISGFVLSYSALRYVHKSQPEKVLNALASSVFRRWSRLFIPAAFATFVCMLVLATGLGKYNGPGVNPTQPTFLGNVLFWADDTVRLTNPFHVITPAWDISIGSKYMMQMWTIPIEFRGSMIVFLLLAGVCKMKPWIRTGALFGSFVLAIMWGTGYASLFIFGMWLADLRLWREQQQQESLHTTLPLARQNIQHAPVERRDSIQNDSSQRTSNESRSQHEYSQNEPLLPGEATSDTQFSEKEPDTRSDSYMALSQRAVSYKPLRRELPYFAVVVVYLYLHTEPAYLKIGADSPFPLNFIAPFWSQTWIVCATMLCYALEQSTVLKMPLETSFSLWLGELSFGIYVMHIIVRYVLWDKYLIPFQLTHIGVDSFSTFLPTYFVFTVAVFWAAEGFRWVDVKCVNLSKKLADWAFVR